MAGVAEKRFLELINEKIELPKELILNESLWVEIWELRWRISKKYNLPWEF